MSEDAEYQRQCQQAFNTQILLHHKANKLNSFYPKDSVFFQLAYKGLLDVELQYVRSLVLDIKSKDVPGAFVEFGIFQGAWLRHFCAMTEQAGLSEREIWGFDSFRGLSKPDPLADGAFWKEGMYAASRSEVEANVGIANLPRINLIEGFFSESLRGAAAAALGDVAFARIDCDIYEPTVDCLAYVGSRLTHGSVLVFDDWPHTHRLGEARAFFEWIPTVPNLKFEFLVFGPWDHCYMRVWHRDKL